MDKVRVKYYEGEKTGVDKTIVHAVAYGKLRTISEEVLLENYDETNIYGLCVSTLDGIKVNWKYVKNGKKTTKRGEADGIILRVYDSEEIRLELRRTYEYIKNCYGHRCNGASVLDSIENGAVRGSFF